MAQSEMASFIDNMVFSETLDQKLLTAKKKFIKGSQTDVKNKRLLFVTQSNKSQTDNIKHFK